MLADNKAITSAKLVKDAVHDESNLEVSDPLVRHVMRKEMNCGYRIARTVPIQSNSERCLILRQQYAMIMLPLLEAGCFSSPPSQYIINIDESWLNGTRFVRRIWAPSGSSATITDKQVSPRISLIIALDTEGRLWYALTQANTDGDVMTLFMRKLTERLDRERPGWQENTTILLDGAPWHTTPVVKKRLARM